MVRLNGAELNRVTTANPTAEAIYNALKKRKRNRQMTDLRQFFRKMKIDDNETIKDSDAMKFFQELDQLGVGSLILRKKMPPRFKWGWSLKDVVKAIHHRGLKPREKGQPLPSKESNVHQFPKQNNGETKIVVKLSDKEPIVINLPSGLTRGDFQDIGDMIKELG